MFFLPLKLDFAISSRPKIARAIVRTRKLATSLPVLFFNTCSTVESFGGVSNGGGLITCSALGGGGLITCSALGEVRSIDTIGEASPDDGPGDDNVIVAVGECGKYPSVSHELK